MMSGSFYILYDIILNMTRLTKILLNIEDRARRFFEGFPFIHAFFAGVGVVLFWRGVWETSDHLGLNSEWSIVFGIIILGSIGLFLQTFVGNTIIIKKVDTEKKVEQEIKAELQKTEQETGTEEVTLAHLARKIEAIDAKVNSLLEDSKS